MALSDSWEWEPRTRPVLQEVFFAFVRYLNHSSLSLAYLIMFLVLARGKLYIHTFSSKFISPDPA